MNETNHLFHILEYIAHCEQDLLQQHISTRVRNFSLRSGSAEHMWELVVVSGMSGSDSKFKVIQRKIVALAEY